MSKVVGINGQERSDEAPMRDESIQQGLYDFQCFNERGELRGVILIGFNHDGATISTLRGENLPIAAVLAGGMEIAKARLMARVLNATQSIPAPKPPEGS